MISVIIPCYNCEDFIERAVHSVFQQTFKDYEIILVDNNSSDNTYNKLLELRKQHKDHIQVFVEKQKGAPAARNMGLFKSKGDYIQFLDADDELKPNKLQSQYGIAVKENADVIIGSRILQYNIDGKIKTHVKHPKSSEWEGLICSDLGITSSNLWRRKTVLQAGGWDQDLTSSQEYNLLFQLLKIDAKFAFDFSVETIIHKSASTISKSTNKQKIESIINNRINLRQNIKAYLTEKGMLSPKLIRLADIYVYNELMANNKSIPEFVQAYLKANVLDIPKSLLFKKKLKAFFN